MATCSIDDCYQIVLAKGLCSTHYNRQRDHGYAEYQPWSDPRASTRYSSYVVKEGYAELELTQEKVGENNGICYRKTQAKRWQAYINVHGKQKSLGSFYTVEEARHARKMAEEKYWTDVTTKTPELDLNEV